MKNVQTPSTVVVPAERRCPRCGAPLGGFGPEGLCGACLFDSGLAADELAAELDLLATSSRRFGDYELVEEIARGGMGVIFKARQVGLNRIVAVKMILRGEFAGVAELARFRAEAETAARLQHPNIVAIHEVGEREGQPFFSMDYVEGQNLAQLVGNTPLPAARAATYLKTIAEAVQYAHSRGVLHRDLKPSNVLMDASDQPRVTDFGLAKRLNDAQLSTLNPHLTLTGQVLGSPNFMPPEQAAGKNNAIGPASDVYSLGAILYHCLTARPPFVAETLTATLRMVAENEAVSPRLLNASVPRDLETICLKCLQKEPQRRYATAQELAEDLHRFLRDEPIQALPVGQTERFWRWCRRNRALASAGVARAGLLVAVSIGSPIAVVRINRERQRAEEALKNEAQLRQQAEANEKRAKTEASKSQQVAQLLKDTLKGVGPSVALGRDTILLQEILAKTVERVGKDLTNQPEVEAELRDTIGEVYDALGQDKNAEDMHRQALAIRRKLEGNDSLAVADSLMHLANAIFKSAEAETLIREALRIRRKLLGNEHPAVADSLFDLGYALYWQDRKDETESLYLEALAMRRKLFGNEHVAVSASLNNLAIVLCDRGKLADAEAMLRESLAIKKKLSGNETPNIAMTLFNLADVVQRQGRLTEAESINRDSLEMRKKLDEHRGVPISMMQLAKVLRDQGRLPEAETMLRDAMAIQKKVLGIEHGDVPDTVRNLTDVLLRECKYAEAEQLFSELLTPTVLAQQESAGLRSARREFFARRGRWKEAAADAAKVVESSSATFSDYRTLGPLLVASADLDGYRQHCQQVLSRYAETRNPQIAGRIATDCLLLPSWGVDLEAVGKLADRAVALGQSNLFLTYFQFAKGFAEYRQGRFASAVDWMQTVLIKTGEDPNRDVQACMVLAMACHGLKQTEKARAALATGVEIGETKLPKLESGDLGQRWLDWLIGQTLMSEARELIEGKVDGGTSSLKTKE